MSDADRNLIRYNTEGTRDTAPGGTYQEARVTSFNFQPNFEHTESQEIRSDRQISNIVRTGSTPGGDVGFEYSYQSHDDWFRAVLQSAAATAEVTVTDTTISAASSDNSFNDSNSGFGSISAGDFIRSSGFSNAANNGLFLVTSATAAKLVVSGGTLVDEGAGTSFTIKSGAKLENGTTVETFHFEQEFTDISPTTYDRYGGCQPDRFTLQVPDSGMITGTMSFQASSWVNSAAASDASATDPATTTDSTSAVYQTFLRENHADFAMRGFTLEVANNLRARRETGSEGPADYGSGRCRVSGTFQAYFSDQATFDRLLNDTTTNLTLMVQDRAGNDLIWWVPGARLSGGSKIAGSAESDILAEFSFISQRDATEDRTVAFFSIGA